MRLNPYLAEKASLACSRRRRPSSEMRMSTLGIVRVLNCPEIRSPDICRCQQSNRNATIGEDMKGTLETLPPAPLYELTTINTRSAVAISCASSKPRRGSSSESIIRLVTLSGVVGHRSDSASIDRAEDLAGRINRVQFDRIVLGMDEVKERLPTRSSLLTDFFG